MSTGPDLHLPSALGRSMMLDHRRLEVVFERLLFAFRAGERTALRDVWTRFDEGLSGHFAVEEQYLLPAFRRTSWREANAIESDHQGFRRALLELGVGVDLHAVSLAMAGQFLAELRAHAKSEERLLYAWAEKNLEDATQRRLVQARLRSAGEDAWAREAMTE